MRTCAHLNSEKLPRLSLLGRVAAGLSLAALCVSTPAGPAALPRVESTTPGAATPIIARDSATGRVRFIGTIPGSPIARPAEHRATASPAALARAFLARHTSAFGIGGARELLVSSVRKASARRSVVRFQQTHDGIPVLGGELVVNLDRNGNVLSAGGEALPATHLTVVPHVNPLAARKTAVAVTARARGVSASTLHANEPHLWIYDPRLLRGPGVERPTLVWRLEVTRRGRNPADELVLVDAQHGIVALHFDQIERVRYRRICDAHNTSAQVPCRAPVRTEGGPPSPIRDVNDAYRLTGAIYDFYRRTFGRDSLDGLGMPVVSTTRWCKRGEKCPWPNAEWDPAAEQLAFGKGFASADDVVAHEYTHGVIHHSSRLVNYYQSGAINESIADTLGELFDQTNGLGTDTRAVRWLIGEDTPPGAVRNMRDPTRSKQPDRMGSPYYDANPEDPSGVHTNDGVGNKAAFLITDGGTFNGTTVRGLGSSKAARIYYELATHQLTSGSDYADLAYALPQACRNLVGTAGITSADCRSVVAAVRAVEMSAPRSYPREAAVCPSGGTAHDLFSDDFENPASGKWTLQTGRGLNTWFYPPPPEFIYATSGQTNLWGYEQADSADYSIAMTRSVRIPEAEAVYLHFKHADRFVDSEQKPVEALTVQGRAFDGGVVEYSTDEGRSWLDAGTLSWENGYDGVISSLTSLGRHNPLEGRGAFVRDSGGYGSSRANLGPLAGQNVRFRFRIGTGGLPHDYGAYGWFVDDVRIYTCAIHPPTTTIAGPSRIVAGQPATWTFSAADPAPDDQAGVFRYSIDWDGNGRSVTVSRGCSLRLTHTYLRAGRHMLGVTAADHHGSESRRELKTIVVRAPVEIASSSLVLARNGYVSVKVRCLVEGSCSTTVSLRSASKLTLAGKTKSVFLGSAKRQIAAGKTARVNVRLAPAKRTLVERLKTLRVRVTVSARGQATTRTLVLSAR